ncbi:Farnesyl-diphosphate farnesyltransferase [Terramyces sp. JEL0728]|nr:Farnesyl-diphosphate farnesyltransferase [Terramyces sp. JEL0728]
MSAILQSLFHPSEIYSLVKYKLLDEAPPNTKLYHLLNATSRSFARVIQSLDPEIRLAVCIFYLVLRGLDTIEDDMTIDPNEKVPLLRIFHEKLNEKGYCYYGNGPNEKDAVLLHSFDCVIDEYSSLNPKYQLVIKDITKKMGNGMADFINKKVDTVEDYNLYTHYVAGLVGIGLTQLFQESKLEGELDLEQANEMGLFLQKTNILKDFLTDLKEGRLDPKEMAMVENKQKALACLNHLIADALELVPSSLSYMSNLQNHSVFHFCAIPQIMAISTLRLFYNNYNVFQKSVKIRRGQAVQLISITDFETMKQVYYDYALEINEKARNADNEDDLSFARISEACANIVRWIRDDDQKKQVGRKSKTPYMVYILVIIIAIAINKLL